MGSKTSYDEETTSRGKRVPIWIKSWRLLASIEGQGVSSQYEDACRAAGNE